MQVRSKMNIAKRVDLKKRKKRTDIDSFKFVFSLDDYDNYHSPLLQLRGPKTNADARAYGMSSSRNLQKKKSVFDDPKEKLEIINEKFEKCIVHI